jgi:hypothetical protein
MGSNAAFCGKNMVGANSSMHGPHADGHYYMMMGSKDGSTAGRIGQAASMLRTSKLLYIHMAYAA